MKKRPLSVILAACMLLMALYASAEENKVMLDVRELGVKFIGTSAQPEDYYGPGVVNMRCAYSSWDKNQEYLWLVSDWSRSPKEPASLYLGEYDMSKIKKIEFDYVTNSASSMEAFVSFTKDAEGTQKVASAKVTEVTGNLANPKHKEMEILDAGYTGPMYLYIDYDIRMFVGNFVLTMEETQEPPYTEEPQNPETFDANATLLIFAVIPMLLAIIKKRAGCVL